MSKPTKRFVVTYRGTEDKQGPAFDWRCYAYDSEHAEMKFWDSGAAEEGWEVVSVDRPRTPHGKVDAQHDREAA